MSESDQGTLSNSSASKDYVGPNANLADSRKPLGTEIPPKITMSSQIENGAAIDGNNQIMSLLSSSYQTQQNLLTKEIQENKALRYSLSLIPTLKFVLEKKFQT